jgi:hypothetical protein
MFSAFQALSFKVRLSLSLPLPLYLCLAMFLFLFIYVCPQLTPTFKLNVPTFGCSSELSYYEGFGFTMSIPLLASLLVLLGYGIGLLMMRKKMRARSFWRARMLQLWSILMFLCYPTVCMSVCQMLLPATVVDGVSYVSPDMSLIFTTATHGTNVFAAYFFVFLYILGIPGLFVAILRQQRQHIFSVLLESDVGEYQAFETGSDDTTKLVRCIGRTPMNVTFGTACTLVLDTKYTVTAFDDETGEAQLNLDDSLTITNNPNDAVALASMSFGWMCANYEPAFWYCTVLGADRVPPQVCPFQVLSVFSSLISSLSPGFNTSSSPSSLSCLSLLPLHPLSGVEQCAPLLQPRFEQSGARRDSDVRVLPLPRFHKQAV